MRGALAKLGGPIGRRSARDHVTDDAQRLVGNEQQPEVELDIVASTSEPEVDYPPVDQPKKKKNPIFAKLVNITTKFGRHKSASGSGSEGKGKRGRKKFKTTQAQSPAEISSTMPSCSGLFESESDRLIVVEPEVETSMNDDVTSADNPRVSAAILHVAKPAEGQELEEKVRDSDDKNVECEVVADGPDGQPEVDDVTRQDGDAGDAKKHRKSKRAKRYAKRAGVTAWKGIRSSWKLISSSLAALSTSTGFTVNTTSGIVQAWQLWHSRPANHSTPR